MNFEKYIWSENLPDENLNIYEPNLDLFFQTMFERQEVWYNRFILQTDRPWTNDEFLHNNKFTNVYRELDRNSQWQIKNVFMGQYKNDLDLLWRIMFFRYLNSPDFFEWLKTKEKSFDGFIPQRSKYDSNEFWQLMQDYRAEGGNPFTNAYFINSQACPGQKRDWCYAHVILNNMKVKLPELYLTMKKAKEPEEIIKYIKTWPAAADFIAHEFYQDFTYAPKYSGVEFMKFDQDDFTNVGPGAAIGIRLIFPCLKGREQEEGIYILRDIAEEQLAKYGDFKYLYWNGKEYGMQEKCNITLHQIEMWLCEFQKYWKMKIGKGKQRSVFKLKTKKL